MARIDEARWKDLVEQNELAFFRADVCLGSPQSFTLQEMADICDEMESTNAAIREALRADFDALPPQHQLKLLDMLCASGSMTPQWWKETLLGPMPDAAE